MYSKLREMMKCWSIIKPALSHHQIVASRDGQPLIRAPALSTRTAVMLSSLLVSRRLLGKPGNLLRFSGFCLHWCPCSSPSLSRRARSQHERAPPTQPPPTATTEPRKGYYCNYTSSRDCLHPSRPTRSPHFSTSHTHSLPSADSSSSSSSSFFSHPILLQPCHSLLCSFPYFPAFCGPSGTSRNHSSVLLVFLFLFSSQSLHCFPATRHYWSNLSWTRKTNPALRPTPARTRNSSTRYSPSPPFRSCSRLPSSACDLTLIV